MSSRLPDFADPSRLCERGAVLEGRVALREFERLTPLLASTEGEAAFTLVFGNDSEDGHVVSGKVRADIALICQRCLTPQVLHVDKGFALGVVQGPDEAARLPEHLDPLLVEAGRLVPRDLIEDELLLAIPAAPMHAPEDCAVDLARINAVAADAPRGVEVEAGRDNPFAILRGLQDDKNSEN